MNYIPGIELETLVLRLFRPCLTQVMTFDYRADVPTYGGSVLITGDMS